ncbi:MAG: aminopeptidase N [Rhizobiales bacterium]|nr:aminopeptidase N [Hyphomicrobiales bacterium]
MRTYSGQPVYLAEYQPPAFNILDLNLDIRLDPEQTVIISTMTIERAARSADGEKPPLVLAGDELKLDFVSINGRDLPARAFEATPEALIIQTVPDERFELQITTRVNPMTNTKLMGLYLTSGIYCTQCEAEGFRRITYFLDRPDVLTRYTTRIEATRRETDVLLANGNLIETKRIEGTDRHYAIWEDPHPKPSYLFALVAGKLAHITDTFTTRSGRVVDLKIYVEPGKQNLCDWAMAALKKCMRWDEDVFGRAYDLDIFMIVAVSDFNMGAMENKGLNIFNDKYVLADTASATDQDFANIEAIIAHEYFHNWTGNRITCRDWFQLCLKEGLTVFRDQEFTSDMRSRPVKRINDVRMLRARQFPEDAGPLAHPVRPQAYHEINNFYTATVYEKGAELVRMIKTIAGDEKFARGLDTYFERHDGEAATIEDFLKALEDGGDIDLAQFKLWYEQSGTPQVLVKTTYNQAKGTLTLDINQTTLPTPGQVKKKPLHIPVRFGLVGLDGADLAYESVRGAEVTGDILHLKDAHHVVTFNGLKERPVPSLLRGFSAPVRLDHPLDEDDLIFLIGHDSDSFNRWQAMQTIAVRVLLDKIDCLIKGREPDDAFDCFFEGVEATLSNDTLDPDFRAQFLAFPSETDLAQHVGKDVNPDLIHQASIWLKQELAQRAHATLIMKFEENQLREAYSPDGNQVGRRSLKNACLSILASIGGEGERLARQQYGEATNLTDRLAALSVLVLHSLPSAEQALADFDRRYRSQPLVMDKWFAVQAMTPEETTLKKVKELMKHPIFSITNPNRIRSLIGSFAAGNPSQFHRPDGAGYQFISTLVVDLDSVNPQVAARLLTSFSSWKQLEPRRRERAERALKRISNSAGLSADVRDIVARTLL